MKLTFSLYSCFILITIFISCKSNNVVWNTHSTYKTGFCGDLFYFYSDNTFYYSTGCEGRNNFAFGKYKKKGNEVILVKDTILQIPLFDTFYPIAMNYDTSKVKIKIVDKFNRPVQGFSFYLFSNYSRLYSCTRERSNLLDTNNNQPINFVLTESNIKHTITVVSTDAVGVLELDYSVNMSLLPVFSVQSDSVFNFLNVFPYSFIQYKLNFPKELFYYQANKSWKYKLPEKINLKNKK